MKRDRRVKVVATLGPASNTSDVISTLFAAGADVFRINLATRAIEQLTFGEFSPNTGAGNWDEDNPLNPDSQYNRLGYGILNLGPMPLPGGRLAFTSNRNGFVPTKGFTNPTLQLFVMDDAFPMRCFFFISFYFSLFWQF